MYFTLDRFMKVMAYGVELYLKPVHYVHEVHGIWGETLPKSGYAIMLFLAVTFCLVSASIASPHMHTHIHTPIHIHTHMHATPLPLNSHPQHVRHCLGLPTPCTCTPCLVIILSGSSFLTRFVSLSSSFTHLYTMLSHINCSAFLTLPGVLLPNSTPCLVILVVRPS